MKSFWFNIIQRGIYIAIFLLLVGFINRFIYLDVLMPLSAIGFVLLFVLTPVKFAFIYKDLKNHHYAAIVAWIGMGLYLLHINFTFLPFLWFTKLKLAVILLAFTEVSELFSGGAIRKQPDKLDDYEFGQDESKVFTEKETGNKRNSFFDTLVIIFGALVFVYLLIRYINYEYSQKLIYPMVIIGLVAFIFFFVQRKK